MKAYKKGDKLNYEPRALSDQDEPMQNCTVDMFEPAGEIFNQPMVSVEEIDHWIPACDCQPVVKK